MIFSKAATARIFKVAVNRILKVRIVNNAVLVVIKGERPQFFSKKLWIAEFARYRREGGQQIVNQVVPTGGALEFEVKEYQVSLHGGNPSCSCKDWEEQYQTLGRGCCKHSYAALGYLGFATLADFRLQLQSR